MRNLDTITLELIKGAIQSARVEMEALIERSAMSPFIREKKDYFTAFFDRDGRLVVSTALPMAAGNLDRLHSGALSPRRDAARRPLSLQ